MANRRGTLASPLWQDVSFRRDMEVRVQGRTVEECDEAALVEIGRLLGPNFRLTNRVLAYITPDLGVHLSDGTTRWTYEGRYHFQVET